MSFEVSAEHLTELPAIRSLVTQIRDEIIGGRHVLLIGGGQEAAGLIAELVLLNVQQGSTEVLRLDVSTRGESEKIESFLSRTADLAEASLIPGGGQRLEDAWISHALVPGGLDRLPASAVEEWVSYLSRTVRHGVSGSHVLFIPIDEWPRGTEVPLSNPRLAVFRLWRCVSALEVRLLCRLAETTLSDTERDWREALLPSLAGPSLRLLKLLWQPVALPAEDLWTKLVAQAQERNWDLRKLAEPFKGPAQHAAADTHTPGAWEPLFVMGAAHSTAEYGSELNVLALAALGDQKAFQHRLWRAQTALLLPLLDQIRVTACERLTARHGRSWPFQFATIADDEDRERVRKDPLATDYGPLEHVLRKPASKLQDHLPLVSLGRTLRNELAHYRPVPFTEYDRLRMLQAQAPWR